MAIDVSAQDFQKVVIDGSRQVPVVVDFWAPWCGPCRTLGPVLDRVAGEAAGRWVLVKVNTDENPGLAQAYGIQGIPAVKAFRDGKVVSEFVGAQPEPAVRKFIDGVVPDEAAAAVARARALAARGDTAEADAAYAAALAADPAQPDALLHSAERAVMRGDPAAARALLGRIRSADRGPRRAALARLGFAIEAPSVDEARAGVIGAPDDPAARFALGQALVVAGDTGEALEIFLGLVKKHRAWRDEAARKAMLATFDLMTPHDPLQSEYRRRLSMELYA